MNVNSSEYVWLGLIAAVPVVIVILVLVIRGYDINLSFRRKGKGDKED